MNSEPGKEFAVSQPSTTFQTAPREERDTDREARFEAIREISRAFADVPDEELECEMARALAEARTDLAAERERARETAARS